jgi:hypothetical protein
MKLVAVLLLAALSLTSCSNSSTAVQTASGSVWQSVMLNGVGTSSGFSFITEFTFSGGGALSISNFQLDNQDTCLAGATLSPAGTASITYNSADTASGTFSFTITSGNGDTVVLTSSAITGTVNTATSPVTLNVGAAITGNWVLTPGASGSTTCVTSGGTFTMTESKSS